MLRAQSLDQILAFVNNRDGLLLSQRPQLAGNRRVCPFQLAANFRQLGRKLFSVRKKLARSKGELSTLV